MQIFDSVTQIETLEMLCQPIHALTLSPDLTNKISMTKMSIENAYFYQDSGFL